MPAYGSSPGTTRGRESHIEPAGGASVEASIAKGGVDFGLTRHQKVSQVSDKTKTINQSHNVAYNDSDSSTQRLAGPPLPGAPYCE